MWRRDRDVQAGVFLPEAPGRDDGRVHRLLRESTFAAVRTAWAFAVHPQRGAVRAALSDAGTQSRHGPGADPGYHCIMEIWWNSREDFENLQRVIADPDRLPSIKEDEAQMFATHSNPMCSVVEYDSQTGPKGETPRVKLVYED